MKDFLKKLFIIFSFLSILFLCACGKRGLNPLVQVAEAVRAGSAPDFAVLHEIDPDIIAWLMISGTDINQPVYSREKGVHIDPVNGDTGFSGPVVLLLGGSEGANAPFHTLQNTYSVDSSLQDVPTVLLYTPQGTQTWQIFGAGAFREMDILNIYDSFRNRRNIPWFVDQWQQHHIIHAGQSIKRVLTRIVETGFWDFMKPAKD